MILDKRSLLPKLKDRESVILELGCGDRKRFDNSIGIDILDYDVVDIVGDVYDVLKAVPSASVSAVYSAHFFEHVPNLELLLEELSRVLAPNGLLEIVVPHFSNPYFYSDYTHKIFYGLYSLSYFSKDSILKRRTPTYQRVLCFDLVDVKLVFKSSPAFPVRYGIKKFFLEKLFNLTTWTKELYEENFCYLFPCYELKFTLRKNREIDDKTQID